MRNLKKVSAIIVAIAMLLSLMSVSVFATDYAATYKVKDVNGTEITSTKVGKDVYVDIYGTPANYKNLSLSFNVPSGVTTYVDEFENTCSDDVTSSASVNIGDGGKYISLNFDNPIAVKADTILGTIKITVPGGATGDYKLIDLGDSFYTVGSTTGSYTAGSEASVTITPSFIATSAKPVKDGVEVTVPVEVPLGTTAAEAVAGITATVSDSDGTNNEPDYAISDWTSTPEYNADTVGTYTFAGKVKIDGLGTANANAEGLPVTVDVKVVPYTDGVVTAPTGTVMVNAEEGITEEAIKGALPETVEVKNSSKTDVYSVVWNTVEGYTNSGKDYVVGNTITVKGTLTSPSKNGYFTTTSTDVSGTVTVVPANIPGGTIKVNNPIENGKAKVTVTVPANTLKKDSVIKVTINPAPKAESVTAAVATDTVGDDVDLTKDYTVTLTVDKTMKALGYAKDEKFDVNVTVDDVTLLNGTDEKPVQGTVVKATSTSGSGFKPGNTVKPTEPTNPTEPTEATEPTEPTNPTEPTTPADKFNDVEDNFWAAEDIYLLRDAGIINGKSVAEFDPEGAVTRAEFTKMIAQLFGVEATSGAVKFEDCGDADWFTPYVAAAVEAGLVTGYSDTEFAPDKTITREEACTIIGRGLKAVAEGELTFTDASDVSEYAAEYVAMLAAKGFINGYEDGSFLPANEITRAESARIVANVFKSLKAEAETEVEAPAETEAEAEAEEVVVTPAEAE